MSIMYVPLCGVTMHACMHVMFEHACICAQQEKSIGVNSMCQVLTEVIIASHLVPYGFSTLIIYILMRYDVIQQ